MMNGFLMQSDAYALGMASNIHRLVGPEHSADMQTQEQHTSMCSGDGSGVGWKV